MSAFPKRVSEQRAAVVDRIIADMQRDELEWTKPFASVAAPQNPISGTKYKGGNRIHLACLGAERGYEDPRWATFNQAKKAGYRLRKGAKSAIVERWKAIRVDTGAEVVAADGVSAEELDASKVFLKCIGFWSVFNFEELEGAPAWTPPSYDSAADSASVLADAFIASSRCAISERASDMAFYSPTTDEIVVPLRGQFADNEAFLRTLLHEMTHSTMHPSTPAARDHGGWFGSPSYAYEELIAELGSVFACADQGLTVAADTSQAHYEQHVAYLQNWISALQDDPSYLFRAAAVAEKAAEYLAAELTSSSCVL